MKKYDCRFSLGDFGSGLGSFAYLKTLPVDYIKIDGAFVKDVSTDPVSRAMVDSIQQMARKETQHHRRARRRRADPEHTQGNWH